MASQICDHKIIVGDFNVAINHEIDTFNYTGVRRPNARACLLEKMEEGGFMDIYRANNPTLNAFTWECASNDKKARLDYFLIDETLSRFVCETNCANLLASDHK